MMKHCFAFLFFAFSAAAISTASAGQFEPGAVWKDTDGKPINAHGGGVLFHGGVYYWYGELKYSPANRGGTNNTRAFRELIAGGISCYSSTNLYDWKNEGVALPSVTNNPASDLFSRNVIERPKVIYNAKTGKFVMWFHQDDPRYAAARAGVAVSDSPNKPFTYLGAFRIAPGVWPLGWKESEKSNPDSAVLLRDFKAGQMTRDMTLFVDDDGKAYQFGSSEENGTMHVVLLTDDYLKPTEKYARLFVGRASEAPAVFKRNGKYYIIASGCTGWDPNTARLAVADHIFGPWKEMGNPCTGPDSAKTFFCQSAFVLKVAGRPDEFIAIFDRWNKRNLQDSRYVWLPVEFGAGGLPTVPWKDRWSLPAARP